MNSRDYLDRVAGLGCICCHMLGTGYRAAEIHHPREGQGMSQRASDWLAIPLCPDCHRGSRGLHGDRTYMRVLKVGELDLLALTIEWVNR